MNQKDYLRIARPMKYTSLYFNLNFIETAHDRFVKKYPHNYEIQIFADTGKVDLGRKIKTNQPLILNNHPSFTVLECLNRMIEADFELEKIIVDIQKNTIFYDNLRFTCYEWGSMNEDDIKPNNCDDLQIYYQSRLVSGIIEYQVIIYDKTTKFNNCTFANGQVAVNNFEELLFNNDDFVVKGTTLYGYTGADKVVYIPKGITHLSAGVFWDNQNIQEVFFPAGIVNIGGDTFYNCRNLKKITIPASVKYMGDNPFAGCPKLKLQNQSENFVLENDALYNRDKTNLIYFDISSSKKEFDIPSTVKIVGKHSFYMCNLERIYIPKSVHKLMNNPFSGSHKLHLTCDSENYKVIDDVIYSSDFKCVVGVLPSIDIDCLTLKPVSEILRNSFYNCKNIRKIILPKTLREIGYNPFVGCENITFVSQSPDFVVEKGLLLSKDKQKLIAYPIKKAVGKVSLPDSVVVLERGAFSMCKNMTEIDLHNVSVIGKSCFSGCEKLTNIYLSDFVSYVGEWAFAHASRLKTISCGKTCFIDNNALLNTKAKVIRRPTPENYAIESENYYVLKSLKYNYENKIDAVLIDPPYNSHIDYIGYQDADYQNGYINYLRDRLEIAYELLADNGFMIVNIDNGEKDDVGNLCIDIFGPELVSFHRWKKKHSFFDANRVVLNYKKVQTDYEYIIICRKSDRSCLNKIMQPYIENGVLKEKLSDIPVTFDCFGTTSSAKDEMKAFFGQRDYFSTPKPVKLLKEFVRATTTKESIVLDFFAGSGTTAHAVMDLNKEDNGNRKFIIITNDESDIFNKVTCPRLFKAKKIYRYKCDFKIQHSDILPQLHSKPAPDSHIPILIH